MDLEFHLPELSDDEHDDGKSLDGLTAGQGQIPSSTQRGQHEQTEKAQDVVDTFLCSSWQTTSSPATETPAEAKVNGTVEEASVPSVVSDVQVMLEEKPVPAASTSPSIELFKAESSPLTKCESSKPVIAEQISGHQPSQIQQHNEHPIQGTLLAPSSAGTGEKQVEKVYESAGLVGERIPMDIEIENSVAPSGESDDKVTPSPAVVVTSQNEDEESSTVARDSVDKETLSSLTIEKDQGIGSHLSHAVTMPKAGATVSAIVEQPQSSVVMAPDGMISAVVDQPQPPDVPIEDKVVTTGEPKLQETTIEDVGNQQQVFDTTVDAPNPTVVETTHTNDLLARSPTYAGGSSERFNEQAESAKERNKTPQPAPQLDDEVCASTSQVAQPTAKAARQSIQPAEPNAERRSQNAEHHTEQTQVAEKQGVPTRQPNKKSAPKPASKPQLQRPRRMTRSVSAKNMAEGPQASNDTKKRSLAAQFEDITASAEKEARFSKRRKTG